MFKINGAYSDELSVFIDKLNEVSSQLENYTIDGSTYGTLMQSINDIDNIAKGIDVCILDMRLRLNELECELKASLV